MWSISPWRLVVLLLWCLALFAGCGSSIDAPAQLVEVEQLPGPQDFPEAQNAFLLDQAITTFGSGPSGTPQFVTEWTQSYVVLRDPEHDRDVVMPYRPGLVAIEFAEAQIVDPSGNTRVVRLEDAEDRMLVSWALHTDARTRTMKLGDLLVGSRVEIRIRYRYEDVRLWQAAFYFTGPSALSRYTVRAPQSWEIRTLADDGSGNEWLPEVSNDGETQSWTWEMADVPRRKREINQPGQDPRLRTVRVQLSAWTEGGNKVVSWSTPEELSAGTYAMISQSRSFAADASIDAVVDEALAANPPDLSSPREIAASLYAWVRENVAYCQIYYGLDGWVPHDAVAIAQNSYGDCKDKAFLLHHMLQRKGIDSALVLVFAHSGEPVEFSLPTIIGNFNHMILRVELPDGPVFVDPTTRTVPFGEVPAAIQGAQVLPATPTGEGLQTIPWGKPEDSSRTTALDLEVFGQRLRGRASLMLNGHHAHNGRWLMLKHISARHPDHFESLLRLSSEAEVEQFASNFEVTQLFPKQAEMSGSIELEDVFVESAQRRLIGSNDLLESRALELPDEPRETDIIIGYPEQNTDLVTIELPSNWTVSRLPEPVVLSSVLGNYALEWQVTDDARLQMRREYTRSASRVETRDHLEVVDFLKSIRRAEADRVVIHTP